MFVLNSETLTALVGILLLICPNLATLESLPKAFCDRSNHQKCNKDDQRIRCVFQRVKGPDYNRKQTSNNAQKNQTALPAATLDEPI